MKNRVVSLICLILLVNPVHAANVYDSFSLTDVINAFSSTNYLSEVTFKTAFDKFKQSNVNSSFNDFKELIENSKNSSVELLVLYEKMYELGFFSLADRAKSHIADSNFEFYEKCVKEFYSPSKMLTHDEEIFLAEIYSQITYNDRAVEAINELEQNKDLLKKSDYANYLMALGYYKSNNFKEAMKFINDAISKNSKCENYKFLKIKLLAETEQRNDALRLFNSYNNKKELPYNYRKKCELLKQFILYKTEKNQWERNYALGRYYYTNGEYQKALKSLQNATLTKNKKDLTKVLGIMSRTYLKLGQDDKAKETALKAIKNDISNKDANVTLARLADSEANFGKALECYKKASKNDKLDTSIIKVAQLYQLKDEDAKAKNIYTSLVKKSDDEWTALYNLAVMDNKPEYLYKSLKANPFYADAWVELIKFELENKNYDKAKEYLNNLLYIDDKDFRYYYYMGVFCRENNLNIDAARNFKKSLDLNPDNYEAEKSLIELREFL